MSTDRLDVRRACPCQLPCSTSSCPAAAERSSRGPFHEDSFRNVRRSVDIAMAGGRYLSIFVQLSPSAGGHQRCPSTPPASRSQFFPNASKEVGCFWLSYTIFVTNVCSGGCKAWRGERSRGPEGALAESSWGCWCYWWPFRARSGSGLECSPPLASASISISSPKAVRKLPHRTPFVRHLLFLVPRVAHRLCRVPQLVPAWPACCLMSNSLCRSWRARRLLHRLFAFRTCPSVSVLVPGSLLEKR